MDFNEHLHSFAEGHSVKEAVISFFVRPRIEQPLDFKRLVTDDGYIRERYAKFELVKEVSFNLTINKSNTELKQERDAGFKMIAYEKGSTSDIIQGINEPRRSVFTFNKLNYDHWEHFLEPSLAAAKEIAEAGQTFWVMAYSLMFIDEFYADEKATWNASELFNLDSRYLPVGIEESSFVDFSLNMNKQKDGRSYIENTSIKVFDRSRQKVVQVIDNISFIQDKEQYPFVHLLSGERLREDLCFAHEENKQMLRQVLKQEIANSIGLCVC